MTQIFVTVALPQEGAYIVGNEAGADGRGLPRAAEMTVECAVSGGCGGHVIST